MKYQFAMKTALALIAALAMTVSFQNPAIADEDDADAAQSVRVSCALDARKAPMGMSAATIEGNLDASSLETPEGFPAKGTLKISLNTGGRSVLAPTTVKVEGVYSYDTYGKYALLSVPAGKLKDKITMIALYFKNNKQASSVEYNGKFFNTDCQ